MYLFHLNYISPVDFFPYLPFSLSPILIRMTFIPALHLIQFIGTFSDSWY